MVVSLAPEPPGGGVDPATADFVDELWLPLVALVELGFAVEDRFGTG